MTAASELAPSARDTVHEDGTVRLYRFRGPRRARGAVLLVPSLINRWYVLDLRRGASVVEALVAAGLDVFCVDWGEPHDEDRHLDWDAVLARLARAARRTRRIAGEARIGLLGYCLGGTLAAIHAALEPERVAALVNLAGPIDFARAGLLAHLTNRRWFDASALAEAGNIGAEQMQAGFVALRPTAQLAKLVSQLDPSARADDDKRAAFRALETWASDNVAFPAAAYVRYIEELYQGNQLVRGEHHIAGRRVDLAAIRCPVLTVTTTKDTICPPDAALALSDITGGERLSIPGGHVGAVVGDKARTLLYPRLAEFFAHHLGAREAAAGAVA
jgi:polyhydroxyalkanoate synthase